MQCYVISEQNPAEVVSYTDFFATYEVKLGPAKLLCFPVAADSATSINLNFSPTRIDANLFKCYGIISSKGANPKATTFDLTDAFISDTVAVGGAQYLCNQAHPSGPAPAQ
jgi:hypothetical protein